MSDSKLITIGGRSKTVSGHPVVTAVPEFYQSDLLQVLEEKMEYMTRVYDLEEENDELRQQLVRYSLVHIRMLYSCMYSGTCISGHLCNPTTCL